MLHGFIVNTTHVKWFHRKYFTCDMVSCYTFPRIVSVLHGFIVDTSHVTWFLVVEIETTKDFEKFLKKFFFEIFRKFSTHKRNFYLCLRGVYHCFWPFLITFLNSPFNQEHFLYLYRRPKIKTLEKKRIEKQTLFSKKRLLLSKLWKLSLIIENLKF